MSHHLTPDQLAKYREQGFVHVRGLLSPGEAADCRAEVHAIAATQGPSNATWSSVKGSTQLTHCHDVQFRSATFTRLLVDPRLIGIAQDIIGPNVQLHHTKMFVKPPEKGSPFPMHQDHPYFPHRDHSMIAVIIHFDDAPAEKGCLRVYPGSHRLGVLPDIGADHHLSEDHSRLRVRHHCRQRQATPSSSHTFWRMALGSTSRTSRVRPCLSSFAIPPTHRWGRDMPRGDRD